MGTNDHYYYEVTILMILLLMHSSFPHPHPFHATTMMMMRQVVIHHVMSPISSTMNTTAIITHSHPHRNDKRMIDGIFRPLSSSLSSSPLLSPPPLLPKSATFYNDITELSNDKLSFLALPDCPTSSSSSSSSLSSSLSVTSSPRIS